VGDPSSISSILWTSDPSTQRAIWFVIVPAAISAITVFGPLILRLGRLYLLERRLRDLGRDGGPRHSGSESDAIREAMLASPVQEVFEEFERRWTTSQLTETQDRAPIRLMDVFDDRPLLPYGPRRSLLPVLPGLFLGLGVFAALTGLIPSLTSPDAGREAGWMAAQLGLALRASAWGFLCAIGASLTGRLLEGGFVARSAALDALMEAHYGSVSPGELAEITRQTQQQNLNALGKELANFANELNERLDRGLQRIEQSTARSASLISQEQRGALHTLAESQRLQGAGSELGGPPVSPAPPREDSWLKLSAAPPQGLGQIRFAPSTQGDEGDTPTLAIIPASPSQFDGGSPSRRTAPETPRRVPEGHVRENADASSSESTGRDLAVSGYQTRALRAQGPDPYERFDSPDEGPSNVTASATQDRELGDHLKLSGLLGPSGGSRGGQPEDSEDEPAAKRSPKPATDGSE
jgi:hypothetical protein